MVYFNRMLTRNSFIRFLSIIILSSVISCISLAYGDYAPNKIWVIFKPGVVETPRGIRIAETKTAAVKAASLRALNAKHGVMRIKHLYKDVLEERPEWSHLANNFILYVPEDKDIFEIIEDYEKDPNVLSVSRVSRVRAFDTNPNDTHFANSNQYGLINIECPQAWDRITGDNSVVIAVLDTGINYNHEDFVGRVDTANDRDFVNDNYEALDDYGHGTSVSGVIGATTNNGKGVAGVDWQAKILPIKVLDNEGGGGMDDIVDGIAWAILKNADVINMSFGQYSTHASLESLCLNAYNAGIVLVAAAGNGDVSDPAYPAYYSTVMAVAAVDQYDKRSIWEGIDPETFRQQASNYGTWVDVAAPGTSIWSTHKDGDYSGGNNGTSLACPFVAGLAGLIKAVNPSLTNQQIMDKIKDTADSIDDSNPEYIGKLGSGRINAFEAVAGITAQITSPESNAYIKGKVNIYGAASGWDFQSYILEALESGTFVTTIEPTSSISVESGILGTWETAGFDGEHTIRLKVFSVGTSSEEAERVVFVDNVTPEVDITFPTDEATVEGRVTIVGTAEDQYLDSYILEYGEGEDPLSLSFVTIREGYVSVTAGALGTWETAGLDGRYTIRLTAYDKVDTSATKSIKVNIRSTSPTKEVTPQAGLPLTYALPNPFDRQVTSEVTFNYSLEGNFDAKIYLFDLSGNLIWQKSYLAGENGGKSGENNPVWDGRSLFGENVSNGVYIYQIVADQKIIARGKVIVLN